MKPEVVIMVAMSRGKRAIGVDNKLLWHIPDDLKRFKAFTLGKPIIMGRKTFESIVNLLGKPLPGRENIVITRDSSYSHPGATVFGSLDDALTYAATRGSDEIHIGGGSQIYEQALSLADRLELTIVDDEPAQADTFFPSYEEVFTNVTHQENHEHNGLKYSWLTLTK